MKSGMVRSAVGNLVGTARAPPVTRGRAAEVVHGWRGVGLSASACAREDRHVGGTRWADASDIHSDAESIRIPLLVCHRVIWDPGYLVERDCYMRAARNLGYSRLQFRTLLASPLTSLSPEHPNNQFVF